jgi:hypothetical protein
VSVSLNHLAEDRAMRRTCMNMKLSLGCPIKCEKCLNEITDCF